ncbi:MAG: carotenoid biosynthesis protein [Bacteroidales bacterium]|nr:carotenoid biosynthesis protein [Bacteroidales bacterium]
MFRSEKDVKRFIYIFFLIGAAGVIIHFSRSIFLWLFPFALLLSLFLMLFYHRPQFDIRTAAGLIFIALAGFFIEVAGVETHYIFGNYFYGSTLGIKILNTPLMIGINWALLVYATGSIAARLTDNIPVRILTGSLLMLLYDILLEQTAGTLDMWYWKDSNVPIRNYLAWFLIAVAFHSFMGWRKIKPDSPVAFPVFFSQSLFFLILLIFFKVV